MPRVFVIQEPLKRDGDGEIVSRFSLDPLRAFGEIEYVFSWSALRDVGMTPDHARIDALVWQARRVLADFSDDDFLVPVGNPALIAIASLVAAEASDGVVNILDWMRQERAYRTFGVDMDCQPGLAAG